MLSKRLKHATFEYDEDKLLHINDDINGAVLSRIEMFSLMRFIIRIAQKGKPRKK